MKIEAKVRITQAELLSMIDIALEAKYSPGRSYGKLPSGQSLSIQVAGDDWIVTWGEPADELIVEPPPIHSTDGNVRGTTNETVDEVNALAMKGELS